MLSGFRLDRDWHPTRQASRGNVIPTASAENHLYVRGFRAGPADRLSHGGFQGGMICDVVFDIVVVGVRAGRYTACNPAENWCGSCRCRSSFVPVATTSRPCAATLFAIARTLSACWLYVIKERSGHLQSPATNSLKPLEPTRSAKGATCRASWCSWSAGSRLRKFSDAYDWRHTHYTISGADALLYRQFFPSSYMGEYSKSAGLINKEVLVFCLNRLLGMLAPMIHQGARGGCRRANCDRLAKTRFW
jgi:hypothetical protein